MSSEYDIIFAGGGTTACVTAGRLIESHPSLKILVVESGEHSRDLTCVVQPCRVVEHFAKGTTSLTEHTSKKSSFLDAPAVVPSAHIVGGGSCVNYMLYARCSRSDYDDWAALGNEGWSFNELLPLIKKIETFKPLEQRPTHGYEGPIQITAASIDLEIGNEFLDVAKKYDKSRPYVDDNNDFKTSNAYSPFYKYIDSETGKRSDAASRYLYPKIGKSNLELLVKTRVKRVIFENGRAIGIEHTSTTGGPVITAKAKRFVVVSAGAFGSPSILERSGIGSQTVLNRYGIPVQVDLPGVGENYQDHIRSLLVCYARDDIKNMDDVWTDPASIKEYQADWEKTGKGKIASNGIDAFVKLRPTEEELEVLGPDFKQRWESFFKDSPDKPIGMILCVAGLPWPGPKPPRKYITIGYNTLYPESIGSVHIKDAQDPSAQLDFDSGFLSKPGDLPLLNWLYKKARELARRLPSYRGDVNTSHPTFPAGSPAAVKEKDSPVSEDAPDIVYSEADNKAISEYHRTNASTNFHSLGTCAMKPREKGGVVDARLNVYGVEGLKVADLSICPTNLGTTTNSTALLIGEKAAVIIAEDLKRLNLAN